jgi:hypothetical protein
LQLATVASPDALPGGCEGLFSDEPFDCLPWYRTTIAHALPAHAQPCFAVITDQGQPVALAPLLRVGSRLSSLTTPYTCVHLPLLLHDDNSAQSAGYLLGRFCRDWPTVRLDAIPQEWPALAPFIAGLRAAGLAVQRFDHFGNWHEPVGGRSWAAYLADRPGALRETVRRKLRRAQAEAQFEIFRDASSLQRGIDAFETVYRASWKEPEPFPTFNAALMQTAAQMGRLRLGVLWVGERAAAAQFWIVADGEATVLKLAHDETFKPLSPGTALTALMLRGLLDDERVNRLDFGRGDDPYKASWTTRRRQRIGLLLMNPRRARGLVAVARSLAGRLRRPAHASQQTAEPSIHRGRQAGDGALEGELAAQAAGQ